MKHNHIISSALVAVVLLAVASSAAVVFAATNTTSKKVVTVKKVKAEAVKTNKVNAIKMPTSEELKARMEAFKAKQDAVKAAITAGDYSAWVTAEKAINEKSKALEKINADNFAKYAEAVKLREQANTIMKDLGLEDGQGLMPMQDLRDEMPRLMMNGAKVSSTTSTMPMRPRREMDNKASSTKKIPVMHQRMDERQSAPASQPAQ